MAHGSCEKLVTMDLELPDEHKNTTVRSKPVPASKADSEEIMRQITECIAADLAEKLSKLSISSTAHPVSCLTNQGATPKRWLSTTGS